MAKDVMDLIVEKLDKIDNKQDSQALILERNTVTLEDHVRRTNLLEEELKPIKAHVNFINMGSKVILSLIALAAALHQLHLF